MAAFNHASSSPQADNEHESITKSFSGLGIDEKSLLTALGKWRDPQLMSQFRKNNPKIFRSDTSHGRDYNFEHWEEGLTKQLKYEFARFKELVVLWAMHPWERDARWAHHVLHKAKPYVILVEISCTRSSEELLGARRAYHSLYNQSLEEGVADYVKENSALLLGLVSAYRYEGPRVKDEIAKAEAKVLGNAIKGARGAKKMAENADVIRILTTRSKNQLKLTFKYYKEIHGKNIIEEISEDSCLQETILCLDSPATYFSKVIHDSFKNGASLSHKEALTRVAVTRVNVDMKEIKQEYKKNYGNRLVEDIDKFTHGNYKDALVSLVGTEE